MAKKKTARKRAKRAAPEKNAKPLVTRFLRAFRLIITKENPKKGQKRLWAWPPAKEPLATSLSTVTDVVDLLGTALATNVPPAAPASTLAFIDQVEKCAHDYPWPTSPDYSGKLYKAATSTIHLYEIGQVVDLMLQAVNAGGVDGGGGGGGSRWPPVK